MQGKYLTLFMLYQDELQVKSGNRNDIRSYNLT